MTDPDAHVGALRPGVGGDGVLGGDRRVDGGPGRLEDGEELVGAGLDLVTAGVGRRMTAAARQRSSISSR